MPFLAQFGCELVDGQRIADADGEGVFDDVAQLSDVSWPSILQESLECFFFDALDLAFTCLVEFVDEVPCERFDIAFTFYQARKVQRYDADAVHEIFAEASCFDQAAQRLVCG